MKQYFVILLLICSLFAKGKVPFTIDIRPRVIDNAKIIVNVEVINHIGRPVDYLEGFITEYSADRVMISEERMVLIYNYEPALQTGFSTSKSISYDLNPENRQFLNSIFQGEICRRKSCICMAFKIRFHPY